MTRPLLILITLLLAGILIPFAIWGETMEKALSLEGTFQWLNRQGNWAWLAGVGLLISDLFLPVPSTVVMSALGLLYGAFWGGVWASLGSFLSGLLAYLLCRALGRPVALKLAGHDGLTKGEGLFQKHGGYLVALSRWMPVLPEAVACLAGMVGMPLRSYIVALACGSAPVGFAFATIGALGQTQPTLAVVLSALLPFMLWWFSHRWLKKEG